MITNLLFTLLGFCIAGVIFFIWLLINYFNREGVIEVDISNPETDRYKLYVEIPIDKLPKKKYARFKIIKKKSHEKQGI